MSLWRVRIAMSDDPASQALLTAALARQRISAQPPPKSTTPGDVIIDLPRDDRLGALLNDLHKISPQVFVSSVEAPPPPGFPPPAGLLPPPGLAPPPASRRRPASRHRSPASRRLPS